jgi:hypothetical protein
MTRALHVVFAWLCAAGLTVILIAWVLPWAGARGYAGEVVRANLREGRDATALFYTESERTIEIMRTLERNGKNIPLDPPSKGERPRNASRWELGQ